MTIGLAAILGQERATLRLERALAAGRLAQAYLFDGPSGVGKLTCALALAAALNCERTPGAASCECDSCRKIAAGVHPDVRVIQPGGAGGFITIAEVREVLELCAFPPNEGRARLVVFQDADRMNAPAQNAFLKTLEEPPARSHFVLTSASPDRLLLTIRSRCQRVRFAPLPEAVVAEILAGEGLDGPAALAASRLGEGSLERARALADGSTLEARWDRARGLLASARAAGVGAAIRAAAAAAEAKDDLPATLELVIHFYKDAVHASAGAQVLAPPLPGYAEELGALGQTPAAELARRAQAALEAQTALLGFASAPLAVENMLLSWRRGV